ncbi:MAG: flagellar motor switch protein FliM [Woeseiaceae bacterium]
MAEQILTDDEKNALLDGVSSGAVQVQANGGPQYASVRPFDLRPSSRIVSNSFPRLQAVNRLFAERLATRVEALLQHDLEISVAGIEVRTWTEYAAHWVKPCVAAVFTASPLSGRALVVLQADVVSHLVESFFGSEIGVGAATVGSSFTPGELSVANRFCDVVLATVRDSWQPLLQLKPERIATEVDLERVDIARDADSVIGSSFELSVAEHQGAFHVLWPRAMVESLLPSFDGQTAERDKAEDARWEKAIRARLLDSPMRITTCIGHARHSLGSLVALSPGDVIPIESPRLATILAGALPLIKGRFGVHEGRNAVEATHWLHP